MNDDTFNWYVGPMDRKKLSGTILIAYEAYYGQRARSKKAGLPSPTYCAREFMGWFEKNIVSFSGKRASIGRIDHSKGYSFDNIEIQDVGENSKEANNRNKIAIVRQIKQGIKVAVYCKKTDEHIATIPSMNAAAKLFGVTQAAIWELVRGKNKVSRKINFTLREAA